jgi:hypothetical protein
VAHMVQQTISGKVEGATRISGESCDDLSANRDREVIELTWVARQLTTVQRGFVVSTFTTKDAVW